MNEIRVAVIGVGSMGRNHARVYREMPETRLVAIVDAERSVANATAELWGARGYSNVQEMLDCERPEAVSIAVPTQDHFEVTMAALACRAHVLVEKPIAASIDEGRRMIAEAERANRVLQVGHIERYNPAITELKRRLDTGELGRIFQIHARRLGPFPERIRDVGVVVDLATHDIDIMRYLTGSEAVRAYAETKREIHTSREDLFSGMVRFADDTLGVLEINWLTPTKVRELTVTGERGMFRADYLTQDLSFFENAEVTSDQWSQVSVLRGVSEGAMTRFAIAKREPLRAELESFVRAARGEESRVANGRDGLAALELSLLLIESAQSHEVRELLRA